MEQSDTTEMQACGLKAPYEFYNVIMGIDKKFIFKRISGYGELSNRRYCMLGYENIEHRKQSTFYPADAVVYGFKNKYDTQISARFWKPAYLDVANDHVISALFDTSIGKWEVRLDVTESELDAEIQTQKPMGLSLLQLQGGFDGKITIYTAIFAEKTEPLPQEWNANGKFTGFTDNDNVTSYIDSIMRDRVTSNGIRQARVAIAHEGKLLGERTFTLAESDCSVANPTDKMLLGSLSKMFTHATTQRLIDNELLDLTTKLRDVSISKNSSEPQTLRDMIEYMVDQPLDFTPGDNSVYSNFGTMVLSYLVTNLTGIPYMDFLRECVFEDGVEAEQYTAALKDHVNDPIVQESRHVDASLYSVSADVTRLPRRNYALCERQDGGR